MRILSLSLVAGSLTACAAEISTSKTAAEREPVVASQFKGTKRIALTKVVWQVPRYEPIGMITGGPYCIDR
jgi:hypothetical protein